MKRLIHEVAVDERVSRQVIDTVQSGRHLARKQLLKFTIKGILLLEIPIQGLKLIGKGDFLSGNQLGGDLKGQTAGQGFPNVVFLWEIVAMYFFYQYKAWRKNNQLAIVAYYLVGSVDIGLQFQNDPTNSVLRDDFAKAIQAAALNYRNAFKRSNSSRFFKAQVRAVAKSCCNDIMSIIAGIATAGKSDIESINKDLVRLLIRSQTGYWYQTKDIAKHGAPLTRPDAIRIALITFIKDRAIQVATIALIATLSSVILTTLLQHIKK